MKVRKKPVTVHAYQWFKNGDHPEDNTSWITPPEGASFESEGKVVRYYRHPSMDGLQHCQQCGNIMHLHGWIDTLEGGHIVCPGDWIITGIQGEHYPCKPRIFEATYETVEEK